MQNKTKNDNNGKKKCNQAAASTIEVAAAEALTEETSVVNLQCGSPMTKP